MRLRRLRRRFRNGDPRGGDGPRSLRFGETVEHRSQLLGVDVGTERLAARFEPYAGGEWSCDDRGEAEVVDEARDGDEVLGVVTCDGDGFAATDSGGPGPVLEVAVAHVVEGLDHARAGQELLHKLARRGARIGEARADAVDLPPVVHRVDDELALQGRCGNAPVLAE